VRRGGTAWLHDALRRRSALWVFALSLTPGAASAAAVSLMVTDGERPLADAVVSLHPVGADGLVEPVDAQMEQVKSEFTPRVLVVPVGSTVTFPNRDKTRHHVYSFSPTKRFELPLHDASTVVPVTFDSPGVVTVGCNIHDWMLGYVIVLDTPYHGRSAADGRTDVTLPAGRYDLRVWHERLPANAAAYAREVTIEEAETPTIEVELQLPPAPAARGDDRIRALQEKLRQRQRDGG